MNEHLTDERIAELVQEIEQHFERLDFPALRLLLNQLHPADLADLFYRVEPETRVPLFELLEPDLAAGVLVEMEPVQRREIMEELDSDRLSPLVDLMESDDAADIVQDLQEQDEHLADAVMEDLEEEQRAEVDQLLSYPEDTAGGIMAVEFVAVNIHNTAASAIREIRRNARESNENIYQVFVVDDENRLQGVISLQSLVLADDDTPLAELLEPEELITVTPDTDRERVVQLAQKYDLISVPVVDDAGRVLGRITPDDILEAFQEEAHEDLAVMAGTGEEDVYDISSTRISRQRLPWLLFGLLGEMVSAVVISRFQGTLDQLIQLAFFVPVVIAMGGNTGIQSSSIVVRSLALGELSLINLPRRLWVEIKVSIINSLVLSVVLFGIIVFWLAFLGGAPVAEIAWQGTVIGLALICVIVFAAFWGTFFPFILKRLNFDPAVATGPFITVSNDILGLVIYLSFTTYFILR